MFERLKTAIAAATGLELNKLKNRARREYALGNLTETEWKS
jgi:hypothetical protein